MRVLVTGAAGFIGAELVIALLRKCNDIQVLGLDNMSGGYDISLKNYRLERIDAAASGIGRSSWKFLEGDIAESGTVRDVFSDFRPDIVVNLAAQAGVRRSIDLPEQYITSNITGFFNILEACRHSYDNRMAGVKHLVYASSSSVYGLNTDIPYSTDDRTDSPVSLYAATKKCDEMLAHAYSKLYDIPVTGLRFFTVYGPAGRPDMAYYDFTDRLAAGKKIRIFNYGRCRRDFTYIDDIVEGIMLVMNSAPQRKKGEDGLPVPPYRLYNIGNGKPENIMDFVTVLHQELILAGVLPEGHSLDDSMELVPMQPGDVPVTYADTEAMKRDFGFESHTDIRTGLRKFALWYKEFHKNS